MFAETLRCTRPEWRLLLFNLKRMTAAMMLFLIIQLPQANAQDLILQDTTITSTTSYTANSITAGPDFTITGTGDVILSAETIAMVPQIYIVQGGELKVVSGSLPDNITSEHLRIPDKFMLFQNYPNPFNPTTIINYELPITNYVSLQIYNLLGQQVATLVSEEKNAGSYQVEWDASRFSSGIYYYRIEAGEFQDVKKMILLQ